MSRARSYRPPRQARRGAAEPAAGLTRLPSALPGTGISVLASAMIRARIFLAFAFLVAAFIATQAMPVTGAVAPEAGCADFMCTDVSIGGDCPACGGNNDRSGDRGAMACPVWCAAMTAVLPAATEIASAAHRAADGPALLAPNGIAPAPERAPPRTSIPA